MNVTTVKHLQTLPKEWLQLIEGFFMAMKNDKAGLSQAIIRSSSKHNLYTFLTMFIMFGASGVIFNVGFIRFLFKRTKAEWRQESTLYCIALTTAINGLLQSVALLPAALATLLTEYWIFGPVLCYTIPMLQDVPLHVNMMSVVMLAIDRHRRVLHPTIPAISGKKSTFIVWGTSLAVCLPYPAITTYFDLGKTLLLPKFKGVAICSLNLSADMQIKVLARVIFLVMYVIPIGTVALFYVKTSRELGRLSMLHRRTTRRTRNDEPNDVDIVSEKLSQKFLFVLTATFALFMLPLTVFRIVQLVSETYENTAYLKKIFVLFEWIALVSKYITPLIYYLWIIELSLINEVERREAPWNTRRNNEEEATYMIVAHRLPPRITSTTSPAFRSVSTL